ncbi:uncharacterized protein LOC129984659 [Argiope bruennichi]|uniref:uncharacterized protein LOC129984659 n=1 Tax=Argiope bruennichi TaxID=94029 RepID=UPI0024945578|nr:uncharacterized protein LOC129984659 [Argiope bruennichi]
MNIMKRVEEEMGRFPEGSKNHNFFKQLLKNLEPNFLRESVRKELNESHANLSGSIQQYFKYYIIYTSALKAVDSYQSQQNECTRDNMELFYLNILKKYVNNDTSCEKLKFFEECQPLLTKMLESKQKSTSVKLFSKSVEDNINEFCRQFLEYVLQMKVQLRDWEKHFDSALKQLSPRVAILDSETIKLNAITPELQALLSTYYQELTEAVEILNELLELYHQKLDSQLRQSKLALDQSKHLKMKSECLELELLVSTYSKSAVDALNLIKLELDDKIEKTDKNINELNEKLEGIQILGPEYEQLVEKYQLLTENIEKQKWAIKYLNADIASKKK